MQVLQQIHRLNTAWITKYEVQITKALKSQHELIQFIKHEDTENIEEYKT